MMAEKSTFSIRRRQDISTLLSLVIHDNHVAFSMKTEFIHALCLSPYGEQEFLIAS